MLGTDPDNFYHSNEDSGDHIDATTLMRAGYVTAAAVSFLADAGAREATLLAQLVSGAVAGRIGAALAAALNRLAAGGDAALVWAEEENRLRHLERVETAALRSTARLGSDAAADHRLSRLIDVVEDQGARSRELLRRALEDEATARGIALPSPPAAVLPVAGQRVPVRKFSGTLRSGFFFDALNEEQRSWYTRGGLDALQREAILNYADGRRTAAEIRDEVAAEVGPVDVESVLRHLEDLVAIGLMEWQSR
jgi:hypothetical protein